MNYRHQFHAGNFADVMKHVLLLRLLRGLQRKPKGFLFLDTHAGRARYDLSAAAIGDTLARVPEWPEGIGRLDSRDSMPVEVTEYVELVRAFDRREGNLTPTLRIYPGSPWIAALTARSQDRLVFCERHPAEAAALSEEFSRASLHRPVGSAVVHETDGYNALRALLPPKERRALVLIDPPYEAPDEFVVAATSLGEGLRRFATGVFALWYPLTQRARVQEFLAAITALRPPPTLAVELAIAGDASDRKLKGCGLVVVNPPWKFDFEARQVADYLGRVLAQEPGGEGRVTWLVGETPRSGQE